MINRREILKFLGLSPFVVLLKPETKEFVDGFEVVRISIENIFIDENGKHYCKLQIPGTEGFQKALLDREEMSEKEVFSNNNQNMKRRNRYKYVHVVRHKHLVGYLWSGYKHLER